MQREVPIHDGGREWLDMGSQGQHASDIFGREEKTYLIRSLRLRPPPTSLLSESLVGLPLPVSSRVLLKSLLGPRPPSSSELEYIYALSRVVKTKRVDDKRKSKT